MIHTSLFDWKPRPNAMEIVYEAMQPSVRFRRDEIMELPPLQIVRREVEMSPKQAAVYKSVLKHLRAEVDAGVVTIANAAVQLTKLLQISCGFVYTTDGLAAELDPKPRLAVIAETVAEAQAKFLVFCPFRAGVTMIAEHLRKEGWTIEATSRRRSGRTSSATSSTARSTALWRTPAPCRTG
jgi:hypothetical protein